MSTRQRRLLGRALWLLALALAVAGYWEAWQADRSRTRQQATTRQAARLWHDQLASELPAEMRGPWARAGQQEPLPLLACVTREHQDAAEAMAGRPAEPAAPDRP